IRKSFAVFSQFGNYRIRREVLSQLMLMSHEHKYDEFFESLMGKIAKLEGVRNKIVHWVVMVSKTGGKPFKPNRDVCLHEHPDMFAGGKLTKSDVLEFQKKANILGLLVFYFDMYLKIG